MPTTTTADYLDAIQHLSEEATLRLAGVSWDEYEELLSELGDRAGLRVSYDEGRLQILSPTAEHEECKESVNILSRSPPRGRDRHHLGNQRLNHLQAQE